MRIKIDFSLLKLNTRDFLGKCGYRPIKSRHNKFSYVKSLRGDRFPRFHIYVNDYGLNLHLDQKAPSYKDSHAHSGLYNGKLVQKETQRIKKYLALYQS